jgi:aspartyl-tRNA(Asn)/glutamyl-tRNA(Gln) amidotransferase subunit C
VYRLRVSLSLEPDGAARRAEDMAIDRYRFGDLESLARIRLDSEERDRLRLQFARIVEFVEKLKGIDTSGFGGETVYRGARLAGDDPQPCLDREEVLGQAPDREGGFFRVPPVIDTGKGGAGE